MFHFGVSIAPPDQYQAHFEKFELPGDRRELHLSNSVSLTLRIPPWHLLFQVPYS